MLEIKNLKEKERKAVTQFLQWEDRNGWYTDENRDIEGVPRMTYEDTIKYFFGVINSELYYSIADNIFELNYEEVIEYSKRFKIYNSTMYKLTLLFRQTNITTQFYRSLLE